MARSGQAPGALTHTHTCTYIPTHIHIHPQRACLWPAADPYTHLHIHLYRPSGLPQGSSPDDPTGYGAPGFFPWEARNIYRLIAGLCHYHWCYPPTPPPTPLLVILHHPTKGSTSGPRGSEDPHYGITHMRCLYISPHQAPHHAAHVTHM